MVIQLYWSRHGISVIVLQMALVTAATGSGCRIKLKRLVLLPDQLRKTLAIHSAGTARPAISSR
jgi:hypothetical protein